MPIHADALYELRKSKGFSQAEFARRLGISTPYLCQIENGHKPGTPEIIAKAAEILQVRQTAITLPERTTPNGAAR